MDYYLSGQYAGAHLVISPISSEMAIAHRISKADSLGYYLYQQAEGSSETDSAILAKIPSEDAAFELGRMLGLR